ncbi:MAG: hypothetical protein ISR82_06315 [Candidatus Marinimicrobia bacterium]|nr:hypothetical protein [Candidatus Neomarinimicrobiota bacterium]MBL7010818.1 hypothetical protein [Candidatus Neomarinimicrobiota bacterium]MBL7030999.1 hypothetical protein [Candidatus Neomarinimicrobiota bacterium]
MNRLRKIFTVYIIFQFINVASACSFSFRPYFKINPNEFILVGRVVDVVGPLTQNDIIRDTLNWTSSDKYRSKLICNNSYGLLIEVIKTISGPDTNLKYIELYPYAFTPSCAPSPFTDSLEIVKPYRFPINSILYIIGKTPKYFHDQSEKGIQRIESWAFNGGGIATINSNYLNQMYLPFDYSQKFSWENEAPFLSNHSFHFYRLEYRKDLIRLDNVWALNKKIEILERLVHGPINREFAYSKLVDIHISDKELATKLKKKREKILKKALRSKTPIKDWFRRLKWKFKKSPRSKPKLNQVWKK